MADIAFAFLLLLGLISGLRRGFAKPAIGVVALIVAFFAAVNVYAFAGPFAAKTLRLPAQVGFIVGGLGSFFLVYFVVALVGRLVWKGARGQNAMQRTDGAAEGAADLIAGDTKPGPVTIMLKPVPTAAGILYWIDKILGAALGVVQAALVIIVVIFIASNRPLGTVGEHVRASGAYREYMVHVDPEISDMDAVRFVRSIADVTAMADKVEEEPSYFEALARSKELEPLRDYSKVSELVNDPALKDSIAAKRYGDVLKNEKFLALLTDKELLRRVAAIDWKALRARLDREAAAKPADGAAPAEKKPDGGASSGSSSK